MRRITLLVAMIAALLLDTVYAWAAVSSKDIVIKNLSVSPAAHASGSKMTVSYRVANAGSQTVTENYLERFYLSKNTSLDSSDAYLGSTASHSQDLPANSYYSGTVLVTLPNLISGTYYLLVIGDATNLVTESNETNNGLALALAIVLAAPTEEGNQPSLVAAGVTATSLRPGRNYFKFQVDPGYWYSFIVNSGPKATATSIHAHTLKSRGAPAVLYLLYTNDKFQAISRGESRKTYDIPNNYSYAKSAVMFYADPAFHGTPYYNYVYVESSGLQPDANTVYIKLLKLSAKVFGGPFSGAGLYYNSFGHRADIDSSDGDNSPTGSGHLGIDIAPITETLTNDLSRAVVPVADGEVIKTSNLGADGYAVWVYHSGPGYTSIYAHLAVPAVSIGARVTKGTTKIGVIDKTKKDHLHLEIVAGRYLSWDRGYASGTPQVDPLSVVFEK